MMRLKPPGNARRHGRLYWLGTDDLGRDLFVGVLFWRSGVTRGCPPVGAWFDRGGRDARHHGGLVRGFVEIAIMRLGDIVLSIPTVLLAVLTVGCWGPDFSN